MSIELHILLATALLTASIWIPYIIGVNTTQFEGRTDSFSRAPDHRNMEPWIHRAHRAQAIMVEQFAPFAVVVLVGTTLGISNVWTVGCAVVFLVLRIAHAWGMIAGWARFPVRPAIFTSAWITILAYAFAIWWHAPGA